MKNRFLIGGQVSGDEFIGRRSFLTTLENDIFSEDARMNKAIVGLPRTGKTSTVKKCLLQVSKKVICIYEDLKTVENYLELWQEILFDLHECAKKNNIHCTPNTESIFEMMESASDIPWIKLNRCIRAVFADLTLSGYKTVIVFDEFDHASELFEGDTKKYELIRELLSDPRYNVCGITISRLSLYTVEGTTYQSSVFHGVFDVNRFTGFDAHDMKEYFSTFSEYGIRLDEVQKARIVYYCGNIPYLLSILGHYIVDASLAGEPIDIDRIFLQKCTMINNYYRDCVRYMERDGNLKRIIPFLFGPNIGVTRADKDELFNIGYLQETDTGLQSISQYFMSFLSQERFNISIWDNVINLEKKLKQLIEREMPRLVRHFTAAGNDFNSVFRAILSNTPGIETGAITRYDSFIRNNKTVFDINSTYLEVMSIGDVVKIISACWSDVFSQYFNNDLYNVWAQKLERCARARNPVAHGHEEYLTDLERQEVDTYCTIIFRTLEKTLTSVSLDNTPFLTLAQANLAALPVEPQITYDNPDPLLKGTTAQMFVLKIGGKNNNNLRGVINSKYKVVIPNTELNGVNLQEQVGKTITVLLNRISNDAYEATPVLS